MKKNYIFTLLITLFISGLSFGQVIITEIADPNGTVPSKARYIEIFNPTTSAVNLTGWSIKRWTNSNSATTSSIDLTSIGDLGAGTVYVIAAQSSATSGFEAFFGFAPDMIGGTGGAADSNGDDNMAIFDASDNIIDIFGVPGEDGNANGGTCHEFEDGRAERKASSTSASATWNEADWNVWADSTVSGCASHTNSPRSAPTDFDPGAWIGETTSTEPALTISSPSDGAVLEATTSVDVNVSTSNFVVGALNGSGVDGHIHWTLQQNSDAAVAQAMKYDTNDESIPVAPGNSYTIYMELVDNTHTAITPAVNKTVTFSVAYPCEFVLGDVTTTCDAITSGIDTYSGTIAFSGGNSGTTYAITAPAGVTVGGDNPDTSAAGTITFTGMTEGTEGVIMIVGESESSCDLSVPLSSPVCVPFPIIEHFDYTDATNLGDQSAWSMLNSGDEMLVTTGNLDYTGLEASTGNKIKFDESGSETYTAFSDVTSGTVYASFLLKVTGFQTGTNIDLNDGGYIASLAGSTSGYDARFWVRPNPDTSGTTFDIGFGYESSNPTFTTGTYALNDVLFVILAYNMDDGTISTWINPDASSFAGTIPSATISSTDTNPPAAINLFLLRQDSNNETPFVELDAVRISNSWADVTPKEATAAVNRNDIEGFSIYPNPISNNTFTLTSASNEEKSVMIFNLLGKKVLDTRFSGTKSEINVAAINAGIYILKVTEAGKIATKKLVIR